MKRTLSATLVLSAMASIALGGDKRADNTLGSWKFNVGKSNPLFVESSDKSPVAELIVTRQAGDGGVIVSIKGQREDGSKIFSVTTVKYDGEKMSASLRDKLCNAQCPDCGGVRQINANKLIEEQWVPGGKRPVVMVLSGGGQPTEVRETGQTRLVCGYQITTTTVVSKDGRTMTATSERTDSADGRSYSTVIVYDKQ